MTTDKVRVGFITKTWLSIFDYQLDNNDDIITQK